MQSSLLMQKALEIFRRPLHTAALSIGTAFLISGFAVNVSFGQEFVVDTYQSVGHTDDKGEEGSIATQEGEDLPEITDLNGDVAYASGSQSAIPNSIGDSIGSFYSVSAGLTAGGSPGGGRRFKAANDNSPIPQDRVFYDYHYYKNAFYNGVGPAVQGTDVQHHVFGAEMTFWCGMGSVMIQAPVTNSVNDVTGPAATKDTVFGNLAVAVKGIVYQDACSVTSVGLGIDLPTSEDMVVGVVALENKAVLLSPYIAHYRDLGCGYFTNSYIQAVLPVSDDEVAIGGLAVDIDQVSLLYADVSIGRWLSQDGCGNGVAAIGELHYTTNLEDQDVSLGGIVVSDDVNILNATMGVQFIQNCWRITPGLVVPILNNDLQHRQFDWEAMLQVNRMF